MKPRSIREMIQAKQQIEKGQVAPARVWEVGQAASGKRTRRELDANEFRRSQKAAWDKSITSTRRKLGLSQAEFASLLGISVRTLHHWEHGTRTPSGAARVLLRVASRHPHVVLEAAA